MDVPRFSRRLVVGGGGAVGGVVGGGGAVGGVVGGVVGGYRYSSITNEYNAMCRNGHLEWKIGSITIMRCVFGRIHDPIHRQWDHH